MLATLINCALVLLGSAVGVLFQNHIPQALTDALMKAVGLCVLLIGVSSAIQTTDTTCVIVCMVVGTLLGELLHIEDQLDRLGHWLKAHLTRGNANDTFSEGFVNATILFCVGSMAIMGSLEAGLNGDYSTLISKGFLDGITSISFAAAMGVGVAFSALPILVYQGGLTLLAGVVGPLLNPAAVTELSAVGGTIIIGIAVNMLELAPRRLKVANMLPAIFLPLAYIPLANVLAAAFAGG